MKTQRAVDFENLNKIPLGFLSFPIHSQVVMGDSESVNQLKKHPLTGDHISWCWLAGNS